MLKWLSFVNRTLSGTLDISDALFELISKDLHILSSLLTNLTSGWSLEVHWCFMPYWHHLSGSQGNYGSLG